MSRPTYLLKHEHRVIEQAMRALDGMCFRIRAGSGVPAEELSKLPYFIRNFADGIHHAKEEAYLFPALEQVGIGGDHGAVAFLRREHETERRLLDELELAVEEYRYDSTAGEKFVSAALQFKNHLIEHMQQEDAILFRLAEETLNDQARESLTHALAGENAENRELIQCYERLAEELERDWAV